MSVKEAIKTTCTVATSPFGQRFGEIGPFQELFDGVSNPITAPDLKGVDALLLWGGEDIHPSFYRQKKHHASGAKNAPSDRDWMEWQWMHDARDKGIPIIGVCRGAQFLCAFAGGSLYQHVNNHGQNHLIKTFDDQEFSVTSSHHQMMNPYETEHEMIAWSSYPRSSIYEQETHLTDKEQLSRQEPEIVYFPEVNGFAIQPHPEWMDNSLPFNKWLVETLLNKCFS